MRNQVARRELSATKLRNLRTLLLLNVFALEEIGARIAQAREEAGLRQEDLAPLIEVSTRTVQNYEAGATKPFGKLHAIARVTGASVEWILHGTPTATDAQGEDDSRARLGALAIEQARQAAELGEHGELLLEILRRLPGDPAVEQAAGG